MEKRNGMKHILKTLKNLAFAVLLVSADAARADVLTGTVVDEGGVPVEYATVVALQDSLERSVAVTDTLGRYRMELPSGRYRAVFAMVGYQRQEKAVDVSGAARLDAVMAVDGVVMQDVEVRASAIRREPDRFVMVVEDMPSAIGKDGKELLRDAPGVWIDDDKISINGKSGVKVFVNERELKMNNDQLQAFLRSLKAEDVSKVEVVPQTGVEYSADTSSGVIKITMKKNRADGVMGNVGVSGSFGKNEINVFPTASVNVKKGKWSFNVNGSMSSMPRMRRDMEERNDYSDGRSYATNTLINADKMMYGSMLAGLFFDPDKKNSFGLEFTGSLFRNPSRTGTDAVFDRLESADRLAGSYLTHGRDKYFNLTFNWVHRLDTLGSTMKAIGGYIRSNDRQLMDNRMRTWLMPELVLTRDSVSKSNEHSLYDVANISYDFDKIFNSKWSFSAGAKYTLNKMRNEAFHEWLDGGLWRPVDGRNYDEDYTENIYAVYAKTSATFGRWSLLAGLRGEMTDGENASGLVRQSYFDVFPNANVSYSFDDNGSNSLTASYSRSISRPSFWALNPIRQQSSDYFYQTGNPDLKPSYTNNVSLTAVYKYRYSLTVWADVSVDRMIQGLVADAQNPDNVLMSMVNAGKMISYGASLSLPFQLTKWWSLNANVTYSHNNERRPEETLRSDMVFVGANTGFTIPKDFYFSVSYYGQNRVRQGNMTMGAMHFLGVSLKKSFARKRWTLSLSAENLLAADVKMKVVSETVRSSTKVPMYPTFSVSATYNFNIGKMFQTRSIEKNDDASRMEKGKNQ